MFIQYAAARIEQEYRSEIYRMYMSDSVRLISENLAKRVGGSVITKRYIDIVKRKTDSRSAEEIVNDVIKNAGLEVKQE